MTGAFIILGVTVLVGIILFLTHRQDADDVVSPPDTGGGAEGSGEVCCGRHAVCEKGLSPVSGPVYYDDEELDRYAGREPDSYDDREVEEFREVLYTLIPSDVYPWGVSLTGRGIALPFQLRDEWLMLCESVTATDSENTEKGGS